MPVIVTSAATGKGLASSRGSCCAAVPLEPAPAELATDELAEHLVFRPAPHAASASSAPARSLPRRRGRDRPAARAPRPRNDEALAHIETRLRAIGVLRALEDAGFATGDDVEIGGVVFELDV